MEKQEEAARECTFVPARACPVELDEIPLDVCRLCIEVWRTNRENVLLKRPEGRLEVAKGAAKAPSEPSTPGLSQLSLSELDKLLWEGRIGVDEYLQRRKQIINSLGKASSPFSSFEEAIERLGSVGASVQSAVFVVEGGRVVARHPEDSVMPEGLDGKALKALQELFEALNELSADVRLEFGGKSIVGLGCRGRKQALLVVDSKAKLEDIAEGVREAQTLLREHDNWEEMLPLLYSVAVGGAKLAAKS